MAKTRDLIPEKIVVRGRDENDVVRIEPYFVKPVRLFRGVEVRLSRPLAPYRPITTYDEQIEFERTYPPYRLKKFAAVLAQRFKLDLKACRVRWRRGGTMHVILWEGPGTETDYKKMRAVVKYIEKHAREI